MWILWSVVAGLLLAPYYINTKRLVDRHDRDYGGLLMATLVASFVFAVFALPTADTKLKWLVIAGGYVYSMGGPLFYTAFGHVSALTSAIVTQTLPAVVTLLAWIFLGEHMTVQEVTALIAVFCGSTFATISRDSKRNELMGWLLLVLSVLMTATYNVMTKHARNEVSFGAFELLMLQRTGTFFAMVTLLFIKSTRTRMIKVLRFERREQTQFLANELLFLTFATCFAIALVLQSDAKNVGLIGTIYMGTMQVTVFVYGFATGREQNLARKLFGALIVFAGVAYIATH